MVFVISILPLQLELYTSHRGVHPQGMVSTQAPSPLQGRDGRDGRDGVPGPRGPQGQRGEQGVAGSPGPRNGGVVYTRWGKTSCPNVTGTELVYVGRAGGSWHSHTGGGANYIPLHAQ